ncbi:hypothetical protein Kassivere_00114 [Pseudomonas phage vB_PpuM-Kassivere]
MLPHCTVQKHESVSFQLLIHSMLRIGEVQKQESPNFVVCWGCYIQSYALLCNGQFEHSLYPS